MSGALRGAAAPGTGRSPRGSARPGPAPPAATFPPAGSLWCRRGRGCGRRGSVLRPAGLGGAPGSAGGWGRERNRVPGGDFPALSGSVCGRTGHPSRGAAGSAAPAQPHFVPQLRGARRETRGARVHLPRARDARPPRWERAEGKHQKTERVWSFVKKRTKQNAELKKKNKIKPENLEQKLRRIPPPPAPQITPGDPGVPHTARRGSDFPQGKFIYFVCVCVKMCARERRRTHHFAGITRPDRDRIGNAEASPASSATCWLKHQLGQNKKLLKKNLLKITEIEPPPPSLPDPPRTAHVSCYNYDYQ